jgi:hypothetical protein
MKNPYKYLLVWLSDHVVIFSSLKALIWFKSKNKSWLELFCLNELHYTTETPTTHGHSPLWTHTNPNPIITGEGKFPECQKLPRVPKNRTLGEANLPRMLHSGKNCTQGREAFMMPQSAWHSGEGGTRKRKLAFDGDSGDSDGTIWKKSFMSALLWHLEKVTTSPSALL